MTKYTRMYRLGIRPWERYAAAAAASIAALFDREEAGRPRPPGRALDLGCGRGLYTLELARRGWLSVGVDAVPAAIEAARRQATDRVTFVVGDVTHLPAGLGRFDFFLDVGCFQGLDAGQRRAEAEGVTALANPKATMLMLAFGRTRISSLMEGASREEVAIAFAEWAMLTVEPAETAGLGWPMNRTEPQWYRMRYRT